MVLESETYVALVRKTADEIGITMLFLQNKENTLVCR
jgi:hypothetical protein